MANFVPVTTLEELDSLNDDEIVEGYLSAERGDPEPGENRGKAFWHGWRSRMMDCGETPHNAAHQKLVNEWVDRHLRRQSKNTMDSNGQT